MWADTAYHSAANEAWLARHGGLSRMHHRKPRGKPVPAHLARGKRTKSRLPAKVEHVFAEQKARMRLFVRAIGIWRSEVMITLANMACNMKRWCWHDGRSASALGSGLNKDGDASEMQRKCRPKGLAEKSREAVCNYATSKYQGISRQTGASDLLSSDPRPNGVKSPVARFEKPTVSKVRHCKNCSSTSISHPSQITVFPEETNYDRFLEGEIHDPFILEGLSKALKVPVDTLRSLCYGKRHQPQTTADPLSPVT